MQGGKSPQEDVEAWKTNPWDKLPTWAKWTVGAVSVLLLLVIGALIGGSEEDELKAELAEVRTELVEAERARDDAEAIADRILDEKEAIVGQAKARASQIVGNARSESSELSGKLSGLRSEVDATKSELAETESSLAGAEREEALSSFGDGIWQAEVDFAPGTYRAPGGDGCYWALLNSADTSDILNNGGFGPNQTITIDSPWFETSGCGQWQRIE